MAPQIIPINDGFRHLKLFETPSTNTVCLDHAQAGDPGNLWITADIQTQGRGSRGRNWETGEGNLFTSLLLIADPGVPIPALAGLTFVASLALRDAINDVQDKPQHVVSLKWPNDVLLNQKKCAGILLETHQIGERTAIIIGFGVNCAWNPEHTSFPATNLQEQGVSVTKETLFRLLTKAMRANLSRWQNGLGFEQIRKSWLGSAFKLGEPITVKIPGQKDRSGIFKTIDEQGLLILQSADTGEIKISTADVFSSPDNPHRQTAKQT